VSKKLRMTINTFFGMRRAVNLRVYAQVFILSLLPRFTARTNAVLQADVEALLESRLNSFRRHFV